MFVASFLSDEAKKAVQKAAQTSKVSTKNTSSVTPAQNSQSWYKGSQPTRSEALARIYTIGQTDEAKARNLMSMFEEQEKDSTSPFYNPYTSATTSKLTKTNLANTMKAQDEWARLSDELSYWATRTDRNYSDDEIISRIDWDNYKTLQKMDEGRMTGSPLELTEAVGYSQDAMYGVLWAARNPGASTGNAMYDAAQRELGRGNQHKTSDVSAYRDATSDYYSPYKAGATALDDLAYKYGMNGDFTREWLEGEGRVLLNGDAQAREDYTRIYKAVAGTEAVEKEANEFYEKYAKPLIEAGVDPARIFYDGVFEDLEYKNLAKFVEGGKSGDLYETAYAVGFDYDELVKSANEYYAKTKGAMTTSEYEQQLANSTGGMYIPDEGTQKSNNSKQLNTDVLLPDYAPAATESERTAFRTTASAGYNDVVGTTANFVMNGAGGEAEYRESAIAEANNFANENLFSAWDDLYQAEAAFAAAGEMDADVSALLMDNFPAFAETGEYPTEQEVLDAFRSGKIQMPEGMLPEDQTAYVESVVNAVAGRGQAKEAQDIIDDVMDDLAEAYGEGTEQYNAAVATYKAAYDYTKSPRNVWSAFDSYQYASQQEGVTPDMLSNYLTNQRGATAREIVQLQAVIENAEKMGIPAEYIENMQKYLGDLRTQNDLLNAHNLSKNEDYEARVEEFNATNEPYKWKLFGGGKITEGDIIRYAVIDIDSALNLAGNKNAGDVLLLAQNMTDEERDNYKYIFMTEGEERANAYFSALSQNLYVRSAEERSGRLQSFAEEHPVAGTAGSFLMVPMESFAAASTIISKISGEEINPYSPTFAATQGKSDLRTGSKEAFHNAVGEDKEALNWAFDTLYDAITSAVDSGINAALGGKYGSVLMGLSGFEAGVMDASIRGASDWQAVGYGLASAAIEGITEKAQIDQIFDSFSAGSKAGKEALMDVLSKSFFSEAGEEMLSSLGGAITDELIMGELSNREAAIEKYMAEAGLTREEAEEQANKDILVDILYSGLVGGLSGTMSSGVSYGIGKVRGSGAETETASSEVAKPEASTAPVEAASGDEKARALSALNTSMQPGASEAQQAATVAGVLQSYGVSDIEANAAAKRIVDSGDARILTKMLSKTTNPELLMKAFAMGKVAENSASAVVLNTKINSKNIYSKTNELLEAYKADTANERVTAVYDAQVAFSAEADMIASQIAATGALDHTAVDSAREAHKAANEKLGAARDEETAAHRAVLTANEKFSQNPSDPAAKAELKSAIDKQYAAQKRRAEAENNANSALKKLEAEKQALNAKAEEFMAIAREQAKPEVQKHVEEVNTAKAEQEAAKETQREADNETALEVDDFISKMLPGQTVTDEERARIEQTLKEKKASVAQNASKEAGSGARAKFVSQMQKKFNVKIRVEDTTQGGKYLRYNGVYDPATDSIVIDSKASQSDVIYGVLLHELTHKAERSGVYQEFASAILQLKYGNDDAKLAADIRAKQASYNARLKAMKALDPTVNDAELTADQASREIVADLTREILFSDDASIQKLCADKPNIAKQILTTIKGYLDKLRGVKDPSVERLEQVRGLFEKALGDVSTEATQEIKTDSGEVAAETINGGTTKEYSLASWTEKERKAANPREQYSLPTDNVLDELLDSYLAGENAPAPVEQPDIPSPKSKKLGISQFAAKTGQNTSVLSSEVKQELRNSPYYQKTSERKNVDIAINNIEIEGYEARRNKLLDGTINLYTPEGQVEAYVLAKAAKEAGDAQGESAIAFKIKESGTLLGQSMAMRKMYLEMTPEGKTQFLQRIVDNINQEYANRGKSTRVVLPEWVEARLEEANGDEELIARVVDKAYTDIAKQMPPDWKSRMNAWRYTAMLANPRTHIRNFVGNMLFMPAVSVKNKIGALTEMAFVAPAERTKSLGPVRKVYKAFAQGQLEEVRDVLLGGGKHNPLNEIQSRRRDFNTPALEWISKKNGAALEAEDAVFLNKHFVNALSGFLQARNVNVNKVDANTLQAGLDYAIGEAQKATYRDASEIADKLSKLSSGLSNSKKRSARAAGLLLEGALPFKKTPVNVMRRGVEYSPVGLLNTLSMGAYDLKKGNIDTTEFIDRLASGLTGTGLAAVGAWLYSMGNLKLKLDEPEDELEKLNGSQEYSIEIFGTSFTIDWMSPSAMPLFVGGAIAQLAEADGEEVNLNTITDALLDIAEPVFNLSMLDGVNSLLSAASYSDNGVIDIAMRAGESYASQFVPSVLGAFARTLDPVRRTTYTDKTSGVPSTLQYLYDSTVNKIPGASRTGQPYLNAWGEEDVTDSVFMRAIENFLSPGYINDLTTDDVEKGLMELYDATKEPGLVPKLPQKYFTVNKQRKDLTGAEYEQLTKERGQTAKNLHEQLFGSTEFLNFPAEYQVYALEQVWEYATQTAKQSVAPEYTVDSWVAAAKDPASAVLEKTQDKLKKDRSAAMKNDLYSAIDSGDLVTAMTYAEGIMQGGTEKGSLRTSITNQYKSKYQQMYEDGDIDGMRQLESTLLALNIGYKMATIQKWIIDKEE